MQNKSKRYKRLFHSSIFIPFLLAASTIVLLSPVTVLAWGDSSGGRQSYTVDEINRNVLGKTIIFNAISDGTEAGSYGGDEKDFVSVKKSSEDVKGIWEGGEILIEDGEHYTIRLYAHNNNPNGYDAVAEDTHVCFSVPQESAEEIEVNGFIVSSNAEPNEYWDYARFISNNGKFHLEYVYGSAILYNDGIGKDGLKLGDEIVTEASDDGVLIGYDSLDGRIPGGYQYDSYITIQVVAVIDHEYAVETKVRLVGGDKTWGDYIDTETDNTVEFQIKYENTSTTETQTNVMVRDILPSNLEYIEGSTRLWNSNHPNGATVGSDGDIITRGVNIGNYLPDGNAYIRFCAKVTNGNPKDDSNTLVNWAQASVKSNVEQDYVSIIIKEQKGSNIKIIIYCVLTVALLVSIIWWCFRRYRPK